MKRLLTLALAGLACGLSPAVAAAASSAQVGDAVAQVTASGASLSDGLITQRWSITPQGQVTIAQLSDDVTARDWALAGAPEFSLLLDSATTSSASGWKLIGATAEKIPFDPARPDAGPGVEIVFRYELVLSSDPIELDRIWTLYPGTAVEGVSEEMVNHSPLTVRVGDYTLASLDSPTDVSAQVQTYHGGSDWRQDFRVMSDPSGSFDDEGEAVQFNDGTGAGWFLVGQRRSGPASRVGRNSSGDTWVGVDNAEDLFDWGPLLTSPPDYNTLANPVYPVPIRQRTLLPYATLDLGQAYIGVYHGGAQQGAAAFVTDFAAHVMATNRLTVDLNTFHPWEHGSGLSDSNLRKQALLFKELGGEVFMLDDQWQGKSAGDWQWDTTRFPIPKGSAVPSFVTYLHSLGLALGLWMSPAEFNPGATVYKEHPTWACTPTGDATAQVQDDSGLGVWDMNNLQLQAYMTAVINRLIAQDDVREFKFDYVAWVDCPPHDYNDYEDAYVNWVHQQQVDHPGVTFELDETNDQRLWPLRSVALGPSWFDNGHLQGSSYPTRLLHDIWSAAPWIPPSSLGFGLYDGDLVGAGGIYSVDYLMPIALLGHVTFWTDLTKLSSAQLRETAWWIRWYKANRNRLAGLVYEDTGTDPIDGKSWAAFQPWDGRRGYLFLFSQGGTTQTQSIALQGLDPNSVYGLRNARTGKLLGRYRGSRLESGLRFTLSPYTAEVISVVPR